MKEFLQIKMEGWTATPRLPFILSGNAVCMATPSYSLLLGMIGCCLGRLVHFKETGIGFSYCYEDIAKDMETRQRLIFDGKRVKPHGKGSDAYLREFHVQPELILWINRLDWENFFKYPIGTPALGRSQDLLKITSVRKVKAIPVQKAVIAGCMIPYNAYLRAAGQIVQLAEMFEENGEIGSGRTPVNSRIFLSIPFDSEAEISHENLYETEDGETFYFHTWQ